ncbi:DNA-binding MarR family transcriptional regulator [Peribacillus deserti]|uniref:DNA-binding MarR family transcriptional regulator n=1 Tax=Peribacillus deserti TaxID=673318 RepID=A0ABS2QGJ3_9BACI|nr:MarR family transcriptional regulator [Peribacillus deserti]MBM7692080.1 DNA-binding MarR family transcriptional regulator [Peribacillus deserti]
MNHTLLKDHIGFTASTTSKMIRGLVNTTLKPFGITAEQWTVLKHLSFVSHINQKDLSKRTDKDQATLTKILDLLEQHRLAARLPNPDDRRSYFVEITEQGKKLVEEAMPLIESLYDDILLNLSSEQVETFMNTLQQIQSNIKKLK